MTALPRTQPPKKHAAWFTEWLPVFAARLCAALHLEELPEAPARYRVGPGRRLTVQRWNKLMKIVSGRTYVERALRQLRIPYWLFRGVLRREPRLHAWYKSVVPGHGPRAWCRPTARQMESILDTLIANPGMSARTACAKHGLRGRSAYDGFLKMTRRPEWEEPYLNCRRLQMALAHENMGAKFEASAGTRQDIREINVTINELRKIEPRRLWPYARARRAQRDFLNQRRRTGK